MSRAIGNILEIAEEVAMDAYGFGQSCMVFGGNQLSKITPPPITTPLAMTALSHFYSNSWFR
jgi:hypothetical protein